MQKLRTLIKSTAILPTASSSTNFRMLRMINSQHKVVYFSTKLTKNKPYFESQHQQLDQEHIEEILEEKKGQAADNQQSQKQSEKKEEIIHKLPPNVNSYKLGKIFGVEPFSLLKKLQQLSRELYTDEFQILSEDAVETLALAYDKEIEFIKDGKTSQILKERAPVVTIMGHVDHGKTTLLDAFRHSTKVKEEFGDITQSIGAFTFKTDSNHEITFIDTPGHEAFNNLRMRGAKVTDIIILVVSAIESIQPQTVEVIEIAKSLKIPVIVAINKIDRPAADVENVLLGLTSHNLIPEQLGGDVICVPISAKNRTNLDELEQKIIDVSKTRMSLMEDYNVNAQCFVIESNFDEKTTQITATVLVKKGTLRQDDIFVCGIHEGKVRFMINDQGKNLKEAYPGQAVKLGGFKTFPDVGSPLYAVDDHDEAQFIVQTIKHRRDKEQIMHTVDHSEKAHSLKKKVHGLTRIEKGKLYSGDKTILYEKLGLIEESDIEKYRKKLGIAKGIDLTILDADDVDRVLSEAKPTETRRSTRLQKAKKQFDQDEFKKIIAEYQGEQSRLNEMDEEEKLKYNEEKMKLKEIFRDEEVKHFPLIIKASTAGTLETLLKETEKFIKGIYRINIIDYGVGPITEGDMQNARQSGAVILGFDVQSSPVVTKSAQPMGVCIRQHKLIYKFVEDVEHFVMDAKTEISQEETKSLNIEVMGTANVSQLFKIKDQVGKNKIKLITVAGARVTYGDLERKLKYRIIRNERVLQDNLKLHSMKKLQLDVTKVEKGQECGIAFENFEGELQQGDVIECYRESEGISRKFNNKPGVHTSY